MAITALKSPMQFGNCFAMAITAGIEEGEVPVF